jgi:predicted GNAT superfamily acetyltransferase
VPASMLRITQRMGGIASGAFAQGGRMAGFVYGVTGVIGGRAAHWSHMLAVLPEFRNRGVGRRLKHHQCALLQQEGVRELRWTFDPLVARNGHLNLNVLGARVAEYIVDAYGDTGSDLHAFGTDRLVVRWCDEAAAASAAGVRPDCLDVPEAADAPVLNAPPGIQVVLADDVWSEPVVRIAVPGDVEAMRHDGLALARGWRASTREAFLRALSRNYEVIGFMPGAGAAGAAGHYILRQA